MLGRARAKRCFRLSTSKGSPWPTAPQVAQYRAQAAAKGPADLLGALVRQAAVQATQPKMPAVMKASEINTSAMSLKALVVCVATY